MLKIDEKLRRPDFERFYFLDLGEGVLKSRNPISERVFTLSTKAFGNLRHEMYEKFSTGADVIQYTMGQSYGRTIGESFKKQGNPFSSFGEWMSILCDSEGWGKIAVRGDFYNGANLAFSLANCAFCEGPSTEHPCEFFRGVAETAIEEVYGNLYASSVTCRMGLEGEHVCEILVRTSLRKSGTCSGQVHQSEGTLHTANSNRWDNGPRLVASEEREQEQIGRHEPVKALVIFLAAGLFGFAVLANGAILGQLDQILRPWYGNGTNCCWEFPLRASRSLSAGFLFDL